MGWGRSDVGHRIPSGLFGSVTSLLLSELVKVLMPPYNPLKPGHSAGLRPSLVPKHMHLGGALTHSLITLGYFRIRNWMTLPEADPLVSVADVYRREMFTCLY